MSQLQTLVIPELRCYCNHSKCKLLVLQELQIALGGPIHLGIVDCEIERALGGLGLHFVRQLMDEVKYKRENNRNYLFLNKKITPRATD